MGCLYPARNSNKRVMDLDFKCPLCDQELTVDSTAAGTDIVCPSCSKTITVPAQAAAGDAPEAPAPGTPAITVLPMPKEQKHFAVPLHDAPSEVLIEKPRPPLEVSAKDGDKKLKVKCIRHHDCVEVGKDKFDEIVTEYLNRIGETNVVSITTINYSLVDIASRAVVTDYGIMIVFKA